MKSAHGDSPPVHKQTSGIYSIFAVSNIKSSRIMEAKKTKEQALEFIKAAVKHKQEWKKELEAEFKGKDVNVVFL